MFTNILKRLNKMEQVYAITIPEGRYAGQQFQVILGGQLTLVTVPANSRSGDLIYVKVKDKNCTSIIMGTVDVQTNTEITVSTDPILPDPIQIPENLEGQAPKHFLCPITECIMTLPVVTPCGITYDYFALEKWLDGNDTDPISNSTLHINQVYPNRILYLLIEEFIKNNEEIYFVNQVLEKNF